MVSIRDLAKCGGFFTRLLRESSLRANSASFSTSTTTENLDHVEMELEEEQKRLHEEKIEKLRDKSGLQPHHFNIQHGQKPYDEVKYAHQETLGYKRRMFGRYGIASQVNPSVLWPSMEELAAKKEYESIAHPHSLPELIDMVNKQKKKEEEAILKRQEEILEKVRTREEKIYAFTNKIRKKVLQAKELKENKQKIIYEIRAKIGYDIDVKHARFQEEYKKMEEEARLRAKMNKKEAKEKKKLEAQMKISKDFAERLAGKAPASEISDDEDDTHPNIDTPSLFRWRHQARVERMEEMKKMREIHCQKKHENEKKRKELNDKILEAQKSGCELVELKKALKELEDEAEDLKKKDEELEKKERLAPWNVDTISHSGFSKTVLNTKPKAQQEELTDEEKEAKMEQFIKEHEKELKQFGLMQKYDDSKRYLQDHLHLVCEETANYFVMWCIKLQMEGKSNLMEHVAHQCICMQFILVLSKQLDVDPRACVGSFFSRIQVADQEYKQSFDDELIAFKDRIRKRAEEKLEIAMKEEEENEKEKQSRLGPGGLDPVEVFESLPDELKKCFESRDIPLLKETIAKMDKEEASYHMQRCVASGLWVPDGGKKENEGEGEAPLEGEVDVSDDQT